MRRPIFWFLWPSSGPVGTEPHLSGHPGPLDADAVQRRWLRVCARGPWRWAFLVIATGLVITAISAAVGATLTSPGLLTVLLSIVIALPLIALLARAWVAGTYVNDLGVKVSGVLTTTVIPWSDVIELQVQGRSRLLGSPIRLAGEQVGVRWSQATTPTHIETASPDLWLRPQAFDAARDRLLTWHRETA